MTRRGFQSLEIFRYTRRTEPDLLIFLPSLLQAHDSDGGFGFWSRTQRDRNEEDFVMTIDELFQQLKHPNPNLRSRAMREIADCRDENTIGRLMGVLDEEDVVYRRAAVKTLGVIGADAVAPVAQLLQESENPTVRASCAKALAQVAVNYPDEPFPEAGLTGLEAALNDDNPVVYIASAMALGEMGAPASPILAQTLKTTDNIALAVAIVNALASVGGDEASEVLTALANDESIDTYIRESATSALSRLEFVGRGR